MQGSGDVPCGTGGHACAHWPALQDAAYTGAVGQMSQTSGALETPEEALARLRPSGPLPHHLVWTLMSQQQRKGRVKRSTRAQWNGTPTCCPSVQLLQPDNWTWCLWRLGFPGEKQWQLHQMRTGIHSGQRKGRVVRRLLTRRISGLTCSPHIPLGGLRL